MSLRNITYMQINFQEMDWVFSVLGFIFNDSSVENRIICTFYNEIEDFIGFSN